MADNIKKIEDLSLNAWPSYQMQVYDGWILRFSYFYTHRTNCAEQIGMSTLPVGEKIGYCESVYRRWKTPCIFKITPISEPSLDSVLEERGYGIEHETIVMTREAGWPAPGIFSPLPDGYRIHLSGRVDRKWLSGLFTLKGGISAVHKRIVPAMYAAIPMDEIAVRVEDGEGTVGTGLGILDRGTVGIYAIHVAERARRQGIASQIVSLILNEAEKKGASDAYLQVVSDNAPAKTLYRKLGFTDSYRCYFRVK